MGGGSLIPRPCAFVACSMKFAQRAWAHSSCHVCHSDVFLRHNCLQTLNDILEAEPYNIANLLRAYMECLGWAQGRVSTTGNCTTLDSWNKDGVLRLHAANHKLGVLEVSFRVYRCHCARSTWYTTDLPGNKIAIHLVVIQKASASPQLLIVPLPHIFHAHLHRI